jgi:hypothetical protein
VTRTQAQSRDSDWAGTQARIRRLAVILIQFKSSLRLRLKGLTETVPSSIRTRIASICTPQKLPIVCQCIIVSAYQAKEASPCKIGNLVEILTSIHCRKPAMSVSYCMGCCTPQDLQIVCGCAYQAKRASPCKMVLWSRLRLVGVCSDLFPFNKTKFNPTRQPAVISNHWFHVLCFCFD